MCVRYDSHIDAYLVWDRRRGHEVELRPDHPAVLAADSTFPGKPGQLVLPGADGLLQMVKATWGLNRNITRKGKWVKERYYNARSETIHHFGVFKEAFQQRRCLVPASAFYERDEHYVNWYRFHRSDGGPLTFAGIYDAPNEAGQLTFAFATTEPNATVANLHDRMPTLLDEDGIKIWLDMEASIDDLKSVMATPPDEGLVYEFAEVVQRGPKPKKEDPSLLD